MATGNKEEQRVLDAVHEHLEPFKRGGIDPDFLGDVLAKHGVEVAIRRDGRFLWINVDTVCVLRIVVDTGDVTIDDRRKSNSG